MKYFIFITLFFLSFATSSAQDNSIVKNTETYSTNTIEKKPEFPGGIGEFYKYIGKNYKMPNIKKLNGKVYVTYVIDTVGSIVDVKVLKDLGHGTGEEAIRVLQSSPKWMPGEQNGQKVRVQYAIPISLQN